VLDEATVLEIGRSERLANCGVTAFEYDPALGRRGGTPPLPQRANGGGGSRDPRDQGA
jgi:hypothetical protein